MQTTKLAGRGRGMCEDPEVNGGSPAGLRWPAGLKQGECLGMGGLGRGPAGGQGQATLGWVYCSCHGSHSPASLLQVSVENITFAVWCRSVVIKTR